MTRERLTLALLLAFTFAVRAIHPDQPIVENYVGRQIPTAMVARNLERGSGFLHPQLDTGPWPNLFLVEPPIYAKLVASTSALAKLDLEPTGRLVSAAATTLAAWGLFGLVRRREGLAVAWLALASFGCFPVMIRYGRAFQPDALMIGFVLAGLRLWDDFEATGDRRLAWLGGFVLSTGLALKLTTAWALLPWLLIVRRWPIGGKLAASAAMLVPAGSWYLWAWQGLAGTGSTASMDNAGLWLGALSPGNWLRFSVWSEVARGLIGRSFTPIGFVLAGGGLLASGRLDRVWIGWAIGCVVSIVALAGKWHHAYYWVVVAPLAAVGVGRGLVQLWRWSHCGRIAAGLLGSFFLASCGWQSASTWTTPVEWADLDVAARTVASLTTEDEPVIAPEAVLYYAGRRGYRLEFDPAATRRAVSEWGVSMEGVGPLNLTESYNMIHTIQTAAIRSSSYSMHFHIASSNHLLVADVGREESDAGRRAWRSAIRRRADTRVVVDRPGSMIAELR